MKIIDGHCHLASTRYIPQQFFEDVAANITCKMIAYGEKVSYSKILQMLLMQHNDHYGDRLIVEMDAASISRTVLLIPDFSSAMAMPLPQREIYEAHFQVTQKYPGRFYVFPGVNPLRGQVALDEFVESIENFGFHGLKLYPPCGYSPSDKCLYPFYDFCQEKSLPVLLHTGPTVQSLNLTLMLPSLICAAARDFPGVNFILAHGAVAYVEEAVELARNWPNLYIDTGGISGAIFPGKWQKQLLSVLLADIENKVIFGSDWPVTRMSGGLKNLVTGITSNPAITQQITPTALQVFFGENITRLIEGG